jgi:NitT/TauT family transport system substrate-binding protein
MNIRKIILFVLFLVVLGIGTVLVFRFSASSRRIGAARRVVRIGYFPNITHAQALIGIARGTFQKHLGKGVIIETTIFNAGPAEIEALYAGAIDIGYIGPGPAINGYMKSLGNEVRIISGSASGGASLVVQPGIAEQFKTLGASALKGSKIASPQQGNTQDLSLRHYLSTNGIRADVTITPMANADQMTLFQQQSLDGAWAPEPWASMLVLEGGGKRIIDERTLWPEDSFATAVVIASKKILEDNPDIIRGWLAAQKEITEWMQHNPDEAKRLTNQELERLTHKKISDPVLNESWKMVSFGLDPIRSSVATFAGWAREEQFITDNTVDINGIFYLSPLYAITGKQY